jgi:cation diffusion facilitator family transporter
MTHAAAPARGANKETEMRSAAMAAAIDVLFSVVALAAATSAIIFADFLKTFLEFVAVLLSWYALRRIRRGGGNQFDYGVGKLENLSSLVVGILMFGCLVLILVNAVRNLLNPSSVTGIGVWICLANQIIYVFINSWYSVRAKRIAVEQNSPLMASQAGLFRTKAVANGFILISLVLSLSLANKSWAHYIDPIASLTVAASILFAALGIFKDSALDLLDRTLEENSQLVILRGLAKYFDRYEELHEIRSRRAGSVVFVEIILSFPPTQSAAEVQDSARILKSELENEIPGSRVTIGLA